MQRHKGVSHWGLVSSFEWLNEALGFKETMERWKSREASEVKVRGALNGELRVWIVSCWC